MSAGKTYDVAVVGAGVFGAWTAVKLARRGQRVLLVDAYGPGHSRSGSGDESRIIRMAYGADEIYTRWSQSSLPQWKELFASWGEALFHETGVLWMAREREGRLAETAATLTRCGAPFEELTRDAIAARYSQIGMEGIGAGLLEPQSGVLMARRATALAVREAVKCGAEYALAQVEEPGGRGRIERIGTKAGERITAGTFVFACGAWLKKLFPEVAGPRLFVTRQEVFYFATPAGDERYHAAALPAFLFQNDECYGMPNIESRGLKIALDRHGEECDPETQSRLVTEKSAAEMRRYVARRFPGLKDAPIAETRVCQYENTSNGDFLVDRHPEMENAWLVGGGSGHGFKHGPAMGEYVAGQILGEGQAEARFLLRVKERVQKRAVY